LGKIRTRNSILYKTDIRGDELKQQVDVFHYQNFDLQEMKGLTSKTVF
jgi:hypothetical protein